MKVKRREWKSWLKTQYSKNKDHGIQSHHFMANRWGNNGNIYFLVLQNRCSHEIKTHFLLGRKAMTNLDSILKSRDITLPTKVCLVKAMVFLVVMCGCESWTIKKDDSWRTEAFELWWLEKTLESPLNCKEIKTVNPKGNQSLLFTVSCSWSWSSSTLATWCEELTHWKRPWCWERLMAGGERDGRGWDGWITLPTRWTWVWARSGIWSWTRKPGMLQSMCS